MLIAVGSKFACDNNNLSRNDKSSKNNNSNDNNDNNNNNRNEKHNNMFCYSLL